MNRESRRSPPALAVLALLSEAPSHPYEMQRLIKQRAKDKVVNVGRRADLYKTIDRLHRDGLIAVHEVTREAGRPERTVYEVTDSGRAKVRAWVREMLSEDRAEFPEFPAAVAHIALLDPDDALRRLEERRTRVAERLERLGADSGAVQGRPPRLFPLEDEYLRAMAGTELRWIDSVIDDLRADRITWDTRAPADAAAASREPIAPAEHRADPEGEAAP